MFSWGHVCVCAWGLQGGALRAAAHCGSALPGGMWLCPGFRGKDMGKPRVHRAALLTAFAKRWVRVVPKAELSSPSRSDTNKKRGGAEGDSCFSSLDSTKIQFFV